MDMFTGFTKKALKAQDGTELPLKDRPGPEGRVIGKAFLRYVEEDEALVADFEVTDPKLKAFLNQNDVPGIRMEDPPDTDFPQSY